MTYDIYRHDDGETFKRLPHYTTTSKSQAVRYAMAHGWFIRERKEDDPPEFVTVPRPTPSQA